MRSRIHWREDCPASPSPWLDLACTVLDMTPQELTEAAQAYAREVEARTDLTLSTKNTYLVHVNRFVEWYRSRSSPTAPRSR